MSTVFVKEYDAPKVDRKEILRYMGCRSSTPEIEELIDKGLGLCFDKLTYKVCYCKFPVERQGDGLSLGFTVTSSQDLTKALNGCCGIILFAATVGLGLDRLIMRYSRTSASLALCLQAIGAERIEALCDNFCGDLKKQYSEENAVLRPRFSAGYGDLPIELQKDIFNTLSCSKNIGLTLNNSMLMSPTKSVTAIVGIKR